MRHKLFHVGFLLMILSQAAYGQSDGTVPGGPGGGNGGVPAPPAYDSGGSYTVTVSGIDAKTVETIIDVSGQEHVTVAAEPQ